MFLLRPCCELVVAEVSRLWKCAVGRRRTLVQILSFWTWCVVVIVVFVFSSGVISLLTVDGLSCLLLRFVSSSCHPCQVLQTDFVFQKLI